MCRFESLSRSEHYASVDLIEVLTEKSEVEGQVDGKHYKKKAEAIIVKAVKDGDRLTRVLRASEMKVRPGSATDSRGKKGRRGKYPSDSASNSRSRSNSRSSSRSNSRSRSSTDETESPDAERDGTSRSRSRSRSTTDETESPDAERDGTSRSRMTTGSLSNQGGVGVGVGAERKAAGIEQHALTGKKRVRPAHPPPRPVTLTPEPTLTRAEAASSSSMNGRRPAHPPPGPPTPTPEQTLTRAEAASSSSMNRRRPAHPPPRPPTTQATHTVA
eukprot:g49500.t1